MKNRIIGMVLILIPLIVLGYFLNQSGALHDPVFYKSLGICGIIAVLSFTFMMGLVFLKEGDDL